MKCFPSCCENKLTLVRLEGRQDTLMMEVLREAELPYMIYKSRVEMFYLTANANLIFLAHFHVSGVQSWKICWISRESISCIPVGKLILYVDWVRQFELKNALLQNRTIDAAKKNLSNKILLGSSLFISGNASFPQKQIWVRSSECAEKRWKNIHYTTSYVTERQSANSYECDNSRDCESNIPKLPFLCFKYGFRKAIGIQEWLWPNIFFRAKSSPVHRRIPWVRALPRTPWPQRPSSIRRGGQWPAFRHILARCKSDPKNGFFLKMFLMPKIPLFTSIVEESEMVAALTAAKTARELRRNSLMLFSQRAKVKRRLWLEIRPHLFIKSK